MIDTSLVATVLNEGCSIDDFLAGLSAILGDVDEVVLVDGGSSDSTLIALQEWKNAILSQASHPPDIQVITLPGVNIAEGRNVGVRQAKGELILTTDAGCRVDPGWAAALVRASRDHPDAIAFKGHYVGRGTSWTGQGAAKALVARRKDLSHEDVLPSSRSFAFRRSSWIDVGGYPEELKTGEDSIFAARLREFGRIVDCPDAIVTWTVRSSLLDIYRQYYRYSTGDAQARQNEGRIALIGSIWMFILAMFFVKPRYGVLILMIYLAYRLRGRRIGLRSLLPAASSLAAAELGRIAGFVAAHVNILGSTAPRDK